MNVSHAVQWDVSSLVADERERMEKVDELAKELMVRSATESRALLLMRALRLYDVALSVAVGGKCTVSAPERKERFDLEYPPLDINRAVDRILSK